MARGNEPDNVTSYLDSQANWGNDRAHYPEVKQPVNSVLYRSC